MTGFFEGVLLGAVGVVVNVLIMRWYVRRGKDGSCPICGTAFGPWTTPSRDDGETPC